MYAAPCKAIPRLGIGENGRFRGRTGNPLVRPHTTNPSRSSASTFCLQYREREPILQSATVKSGRAKKLQPATAKLPVVPVSLPASGKLMDVYKTGQFPPSSRPFALSWTHYVFLIGIKNPEERRFLRNSQGRQHPRQGIPALSAQQ